MLRSVSGLHGEGTFLVRGGHLVEALRAQLRGLRRGIVMPRLRHPRPSAGPPTKLLQRRSALGRRGALALGLLMLAHRLVALVVCARVGGQLQGQRQR
jgi:hypothetical protein